MRPEELLRAFVAALDAHELWIADAGAAAAGLDERVTRLVLDLMKRAGAVEIAESDQQNLLAAVQMAGLGNLDHSHLDSGAVQWIYDLSCEVALDIRARRRQVACRHCQQPSEAGEADVDADLAALLDQL